MPTAGRRRFVPKAIACFLAQEFTDSELVIFDDGDGRIDDLVPSHPRIRYYFRHRGPERSIGELRNLLCDLASGELIAHHDDDDWSHPSRLSSQVAFYSSVAADIVGYRSMLFYRERPPELYYYDAQNHHYAIGTSFLYSRAFWHGHNFLPKEWGEDNAFMEGARVETESGLDVVRMIARLHEGNTSPKALERGITFGRIEDPAQLATVQDLLR